MERPRSKWRVQLPTIVFTASFFVFSSLLFFKWNWVNGQSKFSGFRILLGCLVWDKNYVRFTNGNQSCLSFIWFFFFKHHSPKIQIRYCCQLPLYPLPQYLLIDYFFWLLSSLNYVSQESPVKFVLSRRIDLHINPPRLSFSAVLTQSQSYRSCNKVHWCAGPTLLCVSRNMKSGKHLGPIKHSPTREWDKFRISLPLQPLGSIRSVLQEITDLTASGAACTRCPSLRRMPSEWRPLRIVSPTIWVSLVPAFQGLDPEPYVFVLIHRCILA
jgi:hypothetical protein